MAWKLVQVKHDDEPESITDEELYDLEAVLLKDYPQVYEKIHHSIVTAWDKLIRAGKVKLDGPLPWERHLKKTTTQQHTPDEL